MLQRATFTAAKSTTHSLDVPVSHSSRIRLQLELKETDLGLWNSCERRNRRHLKNMSAKAVQPESSADAETSGKLPDTSIAQLAETEILPF